MDRDSPDWDPFTLISPDELCVIISPRLIELRLESTAVQHIVVIFHEGWWTPRTAEDVELTASGGQHLLDKRDPIFLVMLDAEGLQLLVTLADIGVAGA